HVKRLYCRVWTLYHSLALGQRPADFLPVRPGRVHDRTELLLALVSQGTRAAHQPRAGVAVDDGPADPLAVDQSRSARLAQLQPCNPAAFPPGQIPAVWADLYRHHQRLPDYYSGWQGREPV